ncbi:hypothetical protein N7G274_006564 [Stereocaulon virgatum]|uniref:TFIIF beta subunit HTH domain-containing protein n=1 Tax=Stereocaulon virgatum TaxID=373712 RepID=A0ABR4A566_9LECA
MSIESKMPTETFRKLQIALPIIQPEPDKDHIPQGELIAALREARTEYMTWPLSTLKIGLRQNEAYLKGTLEMSAFPLDIEGSNGYQLRSDEGCN